MDDLQKTVDKLQSLFSKLQEYTLTLKSKLHEKAKTNWLIVFNFGILVWYVNNFDKFLILSDENTTKQIIFWKPFYIFTVFSLFLSILCFAIDRIIIYIKDSAVDTSIEALKVMKMEVKSTKRETDVKSLTKRVDALTSLRDKIFELNKFGNSFADIGMMLFLVNIVLVSVYYIAFICVNL